MKRFLTLLLILVTVCSYAAMRGGAQYDPDAARANLSNVDATATPSMTSITLSGKVKAAWADILGDIYASGTVKVATGTAAAPAYSFASDPDTGIYSAGANEIGFSSGNTERARLLNAPDLRFSSATNSDNRGISFGLPGDPEEYGFVKMRLDSGELRHAAGFSGWGGRQTFYVNGAESMRITSGGNVLIATSTDDGDNKLQVNGNIKCNRIQYDEASIPIFADNAAAIGAGYPIGAVYRTSTGQLYVVYTP